MAKLRMGESDNPRVKIINKSRFYFYKYSFITLSVLNIIFICLKITKQL